MHRSLITAALVVIGAGSASAATITFTHESFASGSIDGVRFGALAPAHFVITAVGDTDNIQSAGSAIWIDHASASIQIDGVGTFSFITPTRTFNNTNGVLGFSRADNGGLDLVDGPVDVPELIAWDMLSSIGPFTGTGGISQWTNLPVLTSGGVLVMDPNSDPVITFQAVVVPAPGVLAAFGLAGMSAARRRRD